MYAVLNSDKMVVGYDTDELKEPLENWVKLSEKEYLRQISEPGLYTLNESGGFNKSPLPEPEVTEEDKKEAAAAAIFAAEFEAIKEVARREVYKDLNTGATAGVAAALVPDWNKYKGKAIDPLQSPYISFKGVVYKVLKPVPAEDLTEPDKSPNFQTTVKPVKPSDPIRTTAAGGAKA